MRHGVHVVSVIGNNGIWALEKHPMEMLYGYSGGRRPAPGTRYDEVVRGPRRTRRTGQRTRQVAAGAAAEPSSGVPQRRQR